MHGTGKTTVIHAIITKLQSCNYNILVACPTGFLATTYKARFHEAITTDTVHSAFHIAVDPDDHNDINWSLSR